MTLIGDNSLEFHYPAISQSQLFDANAKLLRNVGNKFETSMLPVDAEPTSSVTAENILEWTKRDNRRMLHAVYRVGNLDKTIRYVSFSRVGLNVYICMFQ